MFIAIGILLVLIGYSREFAIGFIGTGVGTFALILYLQDRLRVDPVILQIYLRIIRPETYHLEANVSNEGGRRIDYCDVVVRIKGNDVSSLQWIPVDSPLGRIGADWPAQNWFNLYPRRPIIVRGYVHGAPGTHVTLVLRSQGKEYDSRSLTLPASPQGIVAAQAGELTNVLTSKIQEQFSRIQSAAEDTELIPTENLEADDLE